MGISGDTKIVDFDAERVLSAGREVGGDHIMSAVEYTPDDWHALYVADQVLAMYENESHLRAHFDDIFEQKHVDTQEKDLFESELEGNGVVRYFMTRMEFATMLRLCAGGAGQGMWVTIANTAPVVETAEAMREAVDDQS